MCGFAGYINFKGNKVDNNRIMLEMLEMIRHRGPDDSGIIGINTSNKVIEEADAHKPSTFNNDINGIFGFNRLSILDLSKNGHQPMLDQSGQVALMMNGEIYNAFSYTDQLESKGYTFKSTCDTEVVLYLYLEYGMEKMLNMLNGMFGIVILDMRVERIFTARDRVGIKPLYYFKDQDKLTFASELKAFTAFPDLKFELNTDLLDEFLLFRNTINNTLMKGIRNTAPGTFLSFDFNGDCKEITYYDVNNESTKEINDSEAFELLEETLDSSVRRQMLSDVKLGSQLSGGVDSSLVSLYASKAVSKGNLETISIIFDNPQFSEEQYIDFAAKQLDLKAHKFTLDHTYYLDTLEKAGWHFENPVNHPNTIGIYLLSQEAKKYVTVLLSGEGADEALAGYPRFSEVQNPFFSKSFLSKVKQNKSNFSNFISYYSDPDARMVMSSAFGSYASASEMKDDFNFDRALSYRKNVASQLEGEVISRHRKYEIKTYLPDLLMRQDKMSMAHTIENRVPFLDNEMISMSLSLSGKHLLRRKNGKQEQKYILKELCAEHFSEDFAFRKKMGFGVPLKEFMSSEVFQEKLNDLWIPGIKNRGIFNYKTVKTWSENVKTLNSRELDGLWLMTGFEIWAQQFLK